ncbi:hypothetical protein [Collimonas silvisoli]|uniref:hypothetical protein n=1 Tax=Collimonas silvisoli TaxID=2825884 RepID=UPI001B8D2708|nr:hypothetical protein [Collimonas silvisoli]
MGGALDADNNVIGNAVSILNASATIDAGGALTLHTAALTNRNDHFSTELQIDATKTKRVIEYSPVSAPGVWFAADQVTWGDSGDGGIVLILPGNWRNERFHKRDYTQIVQQSVVKTSDPGKITSGGNMVLSGTVTNDKSTIIAGGSITGQSGICGIAGNSDVHTGDKESGVGKVFDQAKVQKDMVDLRRCHNWVCPKLFCLFQKRLIKRLESVFFRAHS